MTKEEAVKILKGIDGFCGDLPEDGNLVEEAWQMAIEALEGQKIGKWVIHDHGTTWWYKCSECGKAGDSDDRFCKHCGAKMEIEHE